MDSKPTFLPLFEKLEAFAQKLPGGMHKPILQAVSPIKDIFLKQRPPRFALTGDAAVSHAGLVNAIFSAPVAPFEPASASAGAPPPPAGWQNLTRPGGGSGGVVRVLDTRGPAGSQPAEVTRGALAELAPDLFLFLQTPALADESELSAQLDHLEHAIDFSDARHEVRPHIVGLVVAHDETALARGSNDDNDGEDALNAARTRLHAALTRRPRLRDRLVPTQAVATFMRFRLDGTFDPESDRRRHIHALVDTLCAELPDEAKLEMARLSGAREAQAKIAATLTKSIAAASGALGIQPIPLADMPFLLAFQTMLVSGIIYISGEELNAKLAGRFLTTMGVSVGIGMALREGARAAAKFVPGWGNAVSGLVAAGGTYAIGRAATAHFIEGVPLPDTKKIFKRANRPDLSVRELFARRRQGKLDKAKNGQ